MPVSSENLSFSLPFLHSVGKNLLPLQFHLYFNIGVGYSFTFLTERSGKNIQGTTNHTLRGNHDFESDTYYFGNVFKSHVSRWV